MTASKIEWTDRSDWNPIRGCTRVSEGCRHCYAEAIAARFSGPGQPFDGFATRKGGEARWTGKVALVEDRLTLPLRWRDPKSNAHGHLANKVFASSTSDIFHESLSDHDIDRIFAVMALAPKWTFQVLTKRSARMREYVNSKPIELLTDRTARGERIWREAFTLNRKAGRSDVKFSDALNGQGITVENAAPWPLPNVWLGVSVEDQARKGRIDDLRDTPAAARFLSLEPLLEDLGDVDLTGIDWVIAGGESGPGARPMHPDWARSLRDQCAAAGVAFHFKQWGEWLPCDHDAGVCWPDDGSQRDMGEIKGLRAVQAIAGQPMWRVGKKLAGRLLDGVTHDGFPG